MFPHSSKEKLCTSEIGSFITYSYTDCLFVILKSSENRNNSVGIREHGGRLLRRLSDEKIEELREKQNVITGIQLPAIK
jgi:hypothetical protein